MVNSNQLNIEYYDELINRLFNSKSYFFNCINKYLNKIIDNDSENQDIVFLIKNFINLLVESEKAIYELQVISNINGFQFFYPKLKERIESVDFSTGTPDKIKEIINTIAYFVIHQLKATLKNLDTRKNLAKYLGLDSSVSDESITIEENEIEVPPINEDIQPQNNDENPDFIINEDEIIINNEVENDINIENEIDLNDNVETSIDKDDVIDLSEIMETSLNVEEDIELNNTNESNIENDVVIDFNNSVKTKVDVEDDIELNNTAETVIDNEDKVDHDESIEANLDNDGIEFDNNVETSIDNENHFEGMDISFKGDLGGFFKKDILKAFNGIASYDKIPSSKKNQIMFLKDWEKCSEDIKLIAMMHGYDDIEAIAIRMLRIISHFQTSLTSPDKQAMLLLLKGKELIQDILSNEKTHNVRDSINLFDDFLKNPDDIIIEDENKDIIEEHIEKLVEKPKQDVIKPIVEIEYNVETSEINPDIFKIPGEDDPELLSLINEIKNNEGAKPEESLLENNIVKDNNEIEKNNLNVVIKEQEFGQKKLLNIDSSLYFKLLNDAIKKLVREDSSESALEDLELASSSLKSYALKFGFEKLGEIPSAIENISNRSIELDVGIPEKVLQLIAEAILLLQTFSDDIKHREKFKAILFNLNQYLNRLIKQRKTVTDF